MKFSSLSRRRRSLGLAVLSLLAWAPLQVHAAPADVLQRASPASDRATGALMLAVTLAGKRLVAVGERGIVLVSDDHGERWRQAKVPVSTTLTGVQFPTPTDGWAVGHSGVVLHSLDAGETWRKQLDGRQSAATSLAAARDLKSADEAARAAAIADAQALVQDGPDKPLFDVHFDDALHGLVVGAYGLAFTTADGGETWASAGARIPNRKGKHLYRIVTQGAAVWLVGEQGALFKAADAASPFVEQTLPYAGTLFGMVPSSDDEWLAYGLRGNAYRTADGGRNWAKVEIADASTLTHGLRLRDGRIAIANQSGRVLVSADRGQHFAAANANANTVSGSPINGLVEAADGSVVAATVHGMLRLPAMKSEGAKP